MTRPRVLITNFHPDHGGGHDTFIKLMATSGLTERFEFALAVPETSHIYQIGLEYGLTLFPCHFPSNVKEIIQIFAWMKGFADICSDFRPQIVHTNGGADNDIVAWSRMFQKKTFQLVRTHHAIRKMPRDPYHQWLYRCVVDRNVYVSRNQMHICRSGAAMQLPNAAVIENGIDTGFFKPMPVDPALKRELGISDGCFVFGSCAGTAGYKRIDVMLTAAAALKDRYAFRILILGTEDARLAGMAESMGLNKTVTFLGFHSDVRAYCALFDVGFILSDAVETISYASREMLSMGLPLISSSYSGLSENIDDGANGFLVAPGDAVDVERKMRTFLEMDRGALAVFRKNARDKAVAEFSIDTQIRRYGDLYDHMLAANASAAAL